MVRFAVVAACAEELAGTASRLKKRAAIVAGLLSIVQPAHDDDAVMNGAPEGARVRDAGLFAMYLAGQAFAEADPRKLNAGGALLSRAVLTVSGAADAALTAAYRRHGDLGAAAAELWGEGPGAEGLGARAQGLEGGLVLGEVAEVFDGMASARTTAVRAGLVEGLLRRASALEAKYLLKLMLGDMRIGVKQSLVEEAIAVAASTHPSHGTGQMGHPDLQPVSVEAVRHAVMLEADLGRAVERAFAGTLAEARMKLFHPLGFMLASPVETPEEAVARFTEAPAKVVAPKIKKGRKRKGSPEEVVAVEAAEEGLAEDVEILAGAPFGGPSASPQDDGERQATEAEAGGRWEKGTAGRGGAEGLAGPSASLRFAQDDSVVDGLEKTTGGGVLAFLEDKYDGMRAQVHCGDAGEPGRVALYSRNREDVTQSFPELAEAFAGVTEPLMLDGEILGWDFAAGQALPFAVLGQRIGRKVVSDEMRRQVPVVFMAFDLLFEGGELILPLPLTERRVRLEGVVERLAGVAVSGFEKVKERAAQGGLFDSGEGRGGTPAHDDETVMNGAPRVVPRLMLSPAPRVRDAAAIDQAYRDARARANEGVMLKAAGSAYLPGRRGLAWVKLKRELATLDVVITGAEFGSGRRAGLLSDYTFAVRGDEGELLNVGKVYSGVTDAEILELTEWLQAHTLVDHGHFRTVEPQIVLEVAFNNIMRSTRHASGFAMRFPRILHIRRDKPVSEIDTLARVEEVYLSQPDRPVEQGREESA